MEKPFKLYLLFYRSFLEILSTSHFIKYSSFSFSKKEQHFLPFSEKRKTLPGVLPKYSETFYQENSREFQNFRLNHAFAFRKFNYFFEILTKCPYHFFCRRFDNLSIMLWFTMFKPTRNVIFEITLRVRNNKLEETPTPLSS